MEAGQSFIATSKHPNFYPVDNGIIIDWDHIIVFQGLSLTKAQGIATLRMHGRVLLEQVCTILVKPVMTGQEHRL